MRAYCLLRVPLDLPPVEPRPPLPKRQYNLLHTQFSNALPASGPRPQSPTKKPPPAAPRTPRSAQRGPTLKQAPLTSSSDPISDLVVRLCTHRSLAPASNTISPPAATVYKHVLAASKAIELSPPMTPLDTINTMATLSAIYILTASKLSGKEITGGVYTRQRAQLCIALEEVGSDWGCATGLAASLPSSTTTKFSTQAKSKTFSRKDLSKAPSDGPVRVKIVPNDVDEALNALMADTKAIAWLGTVPVWSPSHPSDDLPPVQTADEATEFEPWVDPDEVQLGRQRANTGGVSRNGGAGSRGNADHSGGAGIGRMLQDRVDHLSEKRKMGYLEWKRDIMRRVLEVEKGPWGGGQSGGFK
ncbi:hypothetical protein L211DRAFT_98804 [Terfezia boudieri ATCC MYA-4762]|uniref:Origin recognition complex subunit 6 n=1 Tax=Terfezia boudieri ATCC MYA-4762 TaxID=1051890 RepID=A0A3N4LSD5_9PEZI|nr:hypothetical protein L211DRAFT_98804 [Terfezia boudieri ATCC MYA-4762]